MLGQTATYAILVSSILGLAQASPIARRQLLEVPTNSSAVLKRNCAYFGWYPDDGVQEYGSRGTLQTLQGLNEATGIPAFAVGAYAHVDADLYHADDPSTYFNGSEILPFIEQALVANATFVASISPMHGYSGFQANDTNQVEAMVTVLRGFVDAGVTVWLRWGYEMNWYTRKGSDDQAPEGSNRAHYAGNATDFVDAWKVTHGIVKAALPEVKHMWCANVGGMEELQRFWPGEEYVDIVALDYYTELNVPQWRYQTMEPLVKQTHDTFALPYGKSFYLGETGTRSNHTADNLAWIDTITSEETCASMPNYEGAFWFNFEKNDLDHRVVHVGGSNTTDAFVELMTQP